MRDALLIARWCSGFDEPPATAARGRPWKFGAAVKDAVLGPHRRGVIARAGIRARRMAGDQIVDFEAILDQADPLVESLAAALFGCH